MTQYLTKEILHLIRKNFKKHINLKSSALAEALASGYGYKSSISLIAGLKVQQIYIYDLNTLNFYNRLYQLLDVIPSYQDVSNLLYKVLDNIQPYKNKSLLLIGSTSDGFEKDLMTHLKENIKGSIVYLNFFDSSFFNAFDRLYPNQCHHITQSNINELTINPLLGLDIKEVCEVICGLINGSHYPGVYDYLYEFIGVLNWIVNNSEHQMTFNLIADNILLDDFLSFQKKYDVPFEVCKRLYDITKQKNYNYVLMQFAELVPFIYKELDMFSQPNAISWKTAIDSGMKVMITINGLQKGQYTVEFIGGIIMKTLNYFIQRNSPELSIVCNAIGYVSGIDTIYPNINYIYTSQDFFAISRLSLKRANNIIGKIRNISILEHYVNDRYDVRILHDMDKERDNNISQCINYDFCKKTELTVSQYDTYQLLKNDYVLFKKFKDRENN